MRQPAAIATSRSASSNPPSGPTNSAIDASPCAAAASETCASGESSEPRAAGRRVGQEVFERARVGDGGNARAAALLAGGDGDRLPVRALAGAGRGVEAHDAARSRNRNDGRDAELGCLLHDEIHALGASDALHQRDRQRRLGTRSNAACHLGLSGHRG